MLFILIIKYPILTDFCLNLIAHFRILASSNHGREILHGSAESKQEPVFFELHRNNSHLCTEVRIMAKFLSGSSDHG